MLLITHYTVLSLPDCSFSKMVEGLFKPLEPSDADKPAIPQTPCDDDQFNSKKEKSPTTNKNNDININKKRPLSPPQSLAPTPIKKTPVQKSRPHPESRPQLPPSSKNITPNKSKSNIPVKNRPHPPLPSPMAPRDDKKVRTKMVPKIEVKKPDYVKSAFMKTKSPYTSKRPSSDGKGFKRPDRPNKPVVEKPPKNYKPPPESRPPPDLFPINAPPPSQVNKGNMKIKHEAHN